MTQQNGGQIVPYQQRVSNLRGLLEKSKGQIALALPRHMTPDRMLRIAMTSAQTTPKLLECNPRSFIGAVVKAAEIGLEPGNALGHAYLVPFGNEVQLIPGYQGLVELAYRSGKVRDVYAEVVHEKDRFRCVQGLNLVCEHEQTDDADPGPVTHAYAVCHLTTGGEVVSVMTVRELEKIRGDTKQRNRGRESPAWVNHTGEMYKKTVLRRLCKTLPKSFELQTAISLDERHEAGLPQGMEHVIDFNSSNGQTYEATDAPPAPAGDEDDSADRAQLLGEYQERLAHCDTLKAIEETRNHAKGNKALGADGLGKVMGWCDQQAEAVRNSNQ